MSEVNQFIQGEKRPFIHLLELIAKQLHKNTNEVMNINLYLERFTPYSVDKTNCRDLLDGVLHSLEKTMVFPDRVRRHAVVSTSTAEILYGYIEGIPNAITNRLDKYEPVDQNKLILLVFSGAS